MTKITHAEMQKTGAKMQTTAERLGAIGEGQLGPLSQARPAEVSIFNTFANILAEQPINPEDGESLFGESVVNKTIEELRSKLGTTYLFTEIKKYNSILDQINDILAEQVINLAAIEGQMQQLRSDESSVTVDFFTLVESPNSTPDLRSLQGLAHQLGQQIVELKDARNLVTSKNSYGFFAQSLTTLTQALQNQGVSFLEYDERIISGLLDGTAGGKHILLEGPTGNGKSVTSREIARRLLKAKYDNLQNQDEDSNLPSFDEYYSENFFSIGGASATHEELFGTTQFTNNEGVMVTSPEVGFLLRAAAEGFPLIIEEANSMDERLYKALLSILATPVGGMYTSEFGRIKISPGFVVIMNQNSISGFEGIIGVNEPDAAAMSRLYQADLSLPPVNNPNNLQECEGNVLLLRLLSSLGLVDKATLSVNLPQGQFEKLHKLTYVASEVYKAASGESTQDEQRNDAYGLSSEISGASLPSTRMLSSIIQRWINGHFSQSLDEIIFDSYLKPMFTNNLEDFRVIYDKFQNNSFFESSKGYPSIGDNNSIQQFQKLIDSIHVAHPGQRFISSINRDLVTSMSSLPQGLETTNLFQVITACFGAIPPTAYKFEGFDFKTVADSAEEFIEQIQLTGPTLILPHFEGSMGINTVADINKLCETLEGLLKGEIQFHELDKDTKHLIQTIFPA